VATRSFRPLDKGRCELPYDLYGPSRAQARALGAPPADYRLRNALETHLLGRLPRDVIHAP
jgi:hypothetical protein